MRVLLLAEFFLSGQTTHVLDLAEQLQHLGHQAHVRFAKVHSSLFSTEYAPHLKAQGVSFSTGFSPGFLSYLVRTWRPDIIHAHSSTQFALANRLAKTFQIPSILTCHGLGFSQSKHVKALQGATHVIAVGPKVAADISRFCPRLTVIPNGVNTTYYVPPPGSLLRDQVVYIARMDRGKIPALAQLAHILRNCFRRHLIVVADWNPEVPGTIFQSWQADIRPTLQQAGIVAASGRTAREALACGNAVLLIQRGYDGLITPALSGQPDFDFSGNHSRFPFSRLRRDLSRLFSCPPALERLQVWSRRYAVENLSSAQMAQKVLEVYDEAKRLPSKGR